MLKERRLNLYKCGACQHVFTNDSSIRDQYNNDYVQKLHRNWFNNPPYPLYQYIQKEILKIFGNKPAKLLDIGCGTMEFLKYISIQNGSNLSLCGIDLLNNNYSGINSIKGDFFKYNFSTKFDIIVSLGMIEHVDNPNLFIKKIKGLLQENGILIVMTCNSNGLVYRIARLLNMIGISVAHDRLYSSHHLQHFTNKSLKTLLQRYEFNILSQINHNYSTKAVDVPKSNLLVSNIYTFSVWILFLLSSPLKWGILQTVIAAPHPHPKLHP